MGGVYAQRGEQTEVQRFQEILRPGHLLCGGQAHPRNGQGCGQAERGGAHRTHHGYLQYLPQSGQGNRAYAVARGKHAPR